MTGRLRWDPHSGSHCITRILGHATTEEAFRCQSPSKMDKAVVCVYADGPVGTDKPNTAPDLRLILGGKFLDNNEMLNGAPALRPPIILPTAVMRLLPACLLHQIWLEQCSLYPPCNSGKCFPGSKRIQEVIDRL